MELSVYQYIIAIVVVGLAGFVDSIAGGGGLISLPAYLLIGLPPVTASATNKLSAFMGATVTIRNYYKNGLVKLKIAIPCCVVAVVTSALGAKCQMLIPENYLKIIMLIALPLTMLIVLNKKSLDLKNGLLDFFKKKDYALAIIIAMCAGFYDGIYGPGTGLFTLIALVRIVKLDIKSANGITKAINWITNMGSLVIFLTSGKAIIELGLLCGAANMIGSYFGSNLFMKKGVNIARPIMIIVMLIFIVKVVLELLHII